MIKALSQLLTVCALGWLICGCSGDPKGQDNDSGRRESPPIPAQVASDTRATQPPPITQTATPPPSPAQPGLPATIYGYVVQVLDNALMVRCEELGARHDPDILPGVGEDIPSRVLGLF